MLVDEEFGLLFKVTIAFVFKITCVSSVCSVWNDRMKMVIFA